MAKVTLAQLGEILRRERGDRGLREVAHEIGVSPATLSRVERGNVPDLGTFAKICRWLKLNPAEVLGVQSSASDAARPSVAPVVATAHYRADQTTSPELATALADLILAAQRMLAREAPQP